MVVPVLKNQDKNRSDPESYRPIRILSVFSKPLEYLVCLRLREQIEPRMTEKQFGFTANRSSIDAILRMREWAESRDENYVIGMFLDISGAPYTAW